MAERYKYVRGRYVKIVEKKKDATTNKSKDKRTSSDSKG